jgi:hypothetical protein
MPESSSSSSAPEAPNTTSNAGGQEQQDAEFVKKVSERVWQLLRQDLRRDQERRGKRFGR